MSGNPFLKGAINIITALTRDNNQWGSRAFQIWKELRKDPETGRLLDPAQCVEAARQELHAGQKES